MSRRSSCLCLLHRDFGRFDRLLSHVSASLRRILIFDKKGTCAHVFVRPNGAGDVLSIAIAIVSVDENWQRRDCRDLSGPLVFFAELLEIDVRHSVASAH